MLLLEETTLNGLAETQALPPAPTHVRRAPDSPNSNHYGGDEEAMSHATSSLSTPQTTSTPDSAPKTDAAKADTGADDVATPSVHTSPTVRADTAMPSSKDITTTGPQATPTDSTSSTQRTSPEQTGATHCPPNYHPAPSQRTTTLKVLPSTGFPAAGHAPTGLNATSVPVSTITVTTTLCPQSKAVLFTTMMTPHCPSSDLSKTSSTSTVSGVSSSAQYTTPDASLETNFPSKRTVLEIHDPSKVAGLIEAGLGGHPASSTGHAPPRPAASQRHNTVHGDERHRSHEDVQRRTVAINALVTPAPSMHLDGRSGDPLLFRRQQNGPANGTQTAAANSEKDGASDHPYALNTVSIAITGSLIIILVCYLVWSKCKWRWKGEKAKKKPTIGQPTNFTAFNAMEHGSQRNEHSGAG